MDEGQKPVPGGLFGQAGVEPTQVPHLSPFDKFLDKYFGPFLVGAIIPLVFLACFFYPNSLSDHDESDFRIEIEVNFNEPETY
jgi:hypothetical protein